MRGHAVILAASLAWFISIESAEAKLDILVDKATQRMLVIQDGYIRYMWPVSTGRDNMQTPNGVYAPQRLERNWSSTAYYDSPMPFSIFFHNGYAIHGSYAIDRLGGPASHGCVRLHPHHAAILFDLVQQEGPARTTIEVTDQGRPAEQSLPRREIAAGPGVNAPVPRKVNYPDTGNMPDPPPAQRGNRLMAAKNALPPKPVPGTDVGRIEEPSLPRLEIAEGPGIDPSGPRRAPYRATGDMPNLPPAQYGNRLMAAKIPAAEAGGATRSSDTGRCQAARQSAARTLWDRGGQNGKRHSTAVDRIFRLPSANEGRRRTAVRTGAIESRLQALTCLLLVR